MVKKELVDSPPQAPRVPPAAERRLFKQMNAPQCNDEGSRAAYSRIILSRTSCNEFEFDESRIPGYISYGFNNTTMGEGTVRMRHVYIVVGAVVVLGSAAFAEDLVVCDFTGTAPGMNLPWTGTSTLATDVAFSGWDFGNPLMEPGSLDDRLAFAVNGPSDVASTLDDALAQDQYLTATVTPQNGKALDLSGLEVQFSIQRESWHAAKQYAVLWSLDGFTASDVLFETVLLDAGDFARRDFSFFIPFTGYDGVTAPVEFRLYCYEALFNHQTALSAFSVIEYPGNVYTLDASAGTGGTITLNPDATLIKEGATISVTATPDTGYHFTGWSGDFTGLGNPLTFDIMDDTTVVATFAPNAAPHMDIGMNLSAIADWATHWTFTDMFQRMRQWTGRNADQSGGWDSGLGYTAPLDENGWPTHVPFDPSTGDPWQVVHTTVVLPPAIDGTFTLTWRGQGSMDLIWSGGVQTLTTTDTGPHSFGFTIDDPAQGVFLTLNQSVMGDHLRDMHIALPGFADTYTTQPFHPLFLERLDGFTNLRFMGWGQTNGSYLTSWDQRPLPTDYTQAQGVGASLENMALLANTLGQDPWICIPHGADDTYVRECARLLRDQVDPDLRIYVEYSNETWNTAGSFSQTIYVMDQGEALGLSTNRWDAGQFYCSLRSVEIWEIFLEEFVDDSRIVKVMASHSGNIFTTRLRVQALNNPAWNPNRTMPDAIAIAPYFGIVYTPENMGATYPTVDELVTTVSQSEIELARQQVQLHKQLVDQQGVDLICYEGGQHFVGAAGAENDTTLTAILHTANRDPRMYDRYIEYLDMLEEEGVTLFSNFDYVGQPSKWGSWGVLEAQDQPLEEAHKYRALLDWLAGSTTVTPTCHSADRDCSDSLSMSELLRVVQLYNASGLSCNAATEDGFAPGSGAQTCAAHAADYNPQDWMIDLAELLRVIQLYHLGGFIPCSGAAAEDGFCPSTS